jgi:hypothetical protein
MPMSFPAMGWRVDSPIMLLVCFLCALSNNRREQVSAGVCLVRSCNQRLSSPWASLWLIDGWMWVWCLSQLIAQVSYWLVVIWRNLSLMKTTLAMKRFVFNPSLVCEFLENCLECKGTMGC